MNRTIALIACLLVSTAPFAQTTTATKQLPTVNTIRHQVIRIYTLVLKAEIKHMGRKKPIQSGFCYSDKSTLPTINDHLVPGDYDKKKQKVTADLREWISDKEYLFRSYIEYPDTLIYGDLLTCTLHLDNYGVTYESKVGSLYHPSLITTAQLEYKKQHQILHTLKPNLVPSKEIEISLKLESDGGLSIENQGLVISSNPFPTIVDYSMKFDNWPDEKPLRIYLNQDNKLFYRAFATNNLGTDYGNMFEVELKKKDGNQFIVHSRTFLTNTVKPTIGQPNHKIILDLVNEIRTRGINCGSKYYPPVPSVRWSSKLQSMALSYSKEMDRQDQMSHHLHKVPSLSQRARKSNYNYLYIGENLARGEFFSEKSVVDGWFASKDHCINLMKRGYTEVGVARSGHYWTQILATKK